MLDVSDSGLTGDSVIMHSFPSSSDHTPPNLESVKDNEISSPSELESLPKGGSHLTFDKDDS